MMTDVVDKEREEKKFMTEFLMLPCTAIGQTTSSTIAEKSNMWAEQRLLQKKCELDKKLYKNMIKLNSDMLGLNDELAKMRKSASSSSLDSFNSKSQRCGFASGPNSPKIIPKSRPTSHLASSLKSGHQCRSQNISSKSETESGRTSPESVNGLVKNASFHLGSGSSSEDSETTNNEQESKNKKTRVKSSRRNGIDRHDNNLTRTISVTSCQTGRDCGANRADLISFQNATKRYNKTLTDHSLNHHK